ncbi:MAG: hypothetical protein ABF991_07145 [Liquorilactobacillus hordei]|uniref:Uncharacterized protein n=1 Tax=Liquorilactobacillus hordei DSM 19519 TaxID=1423759 RepID=A0A0R1MK15_9LACO|nr:MULTISPECIES: hypothetical protein [Lactobacillaceae]KRL06308.1 hypothetical protein FC92_GL000880 [Liquorilactobacillus hordei DSM 19519]MDN2454072.1 hypothetical protein [Lactobacillus sp. UCMA15818]QYH51153.1 hypothetical protein G6O70_00900 [Liquorilactobacillus hordei DSM 19519]QYH51205.1 hypothetical protein G6O70_01225 [Liquorilactobacillus hordei DSM 19519]
MSLTKFQKQQQQFEELNRKIKAEKVKIEQNLGKQIIKQANLDYANLSNAEIKALAQKVSNFLKNNQA